MKRILVLACASLTFWLLASPLGAQQTPGGSQTQQPTPDAMPPAPAPQAEQLPPPPPFPPMPSARPSHRWVDVAGHRASRAHHRARATHASAERSHHRRTHASRRTAHKARPATHFSKKTIRSCHRMTYRQIMRHSSCRALMKQELAAPAHRHRTSHRATHHKATSHHQRVRHHQVKRRRR